MDKQEKIYTVSEFAAKTGFTRKTILRWIKAGKIAAYQPDKEYRIKESELTRITADKEPEITGDPQK